MFQSAVFAGCLAFFVASAEAQFPELRDAPFEATVSTTIIDSKGKHEFSGRMARNCAGSTYIETSLADTNEIDTVVIVDVPGKRTILLRPIEKLYSVREVPSLEAQTLPSGSVERAIAGASETKSFQRMNGADLDEFQPLGRKDIEGIAALGEIYTRRRPGAKRQPNGYTLETWTSPDLRVRLVSKWHNLAGRGPDQVRSLSAIRRVEPNPGLFAIPSGYRQDPLGFEAAVGTAFSGGVYKAN